MGDNKVQGDAEAGGGARLVATCIRNRGWCWQTVSGLRTRRAKTKNTQLRAQTLLSSMPPPSAAWPAEAFNWAALALFLRLIRAMASQSLMRLDQAMRSVPMLSPPIKARMRKNRKLSIASSYRKHCCLARGSRAWSGISRTGSLCRNTDACAGLPAPRRTGPTGAASADYPRRRISMAGRSAWLRTALERPRQTRMSLLPRSRHLGQGGRGWEAAGLPRSLLLGSAHENNNWLAGTRKEEHAAPPLHLQLQAGHGRIRPGACGSCAMPKMRGDKDLPHHGVCPKAMEHQAHRMTRRRVRLPPPDYRSGDCPQKKPPVKGAF